MGSVDVQKNFNSIPMLGVVPEPVSSDPGSLIEGRLWTRNDLHTLKVYLNAIAKTIATTDDTRFTDGRAPTGAAGGDLTGSTYPNPVVAANMITQAKMARSAVATGIFSGTALQSDPALRRVGLTANDAMQGNFTIADICSWNVNNADVDINNKKLLFVSPGVASTDGVNLQQLQDAVAGLDAKGSVKCGSTANLGLSGLAAIDGYTPSAGERILAKNQTSLPQNGIYIAAAGAWGRASDMDQNTEFSQAFTFIENGGQAGSGWVCSAASPFTVGTTSNTWTQFSSSASITAGNGLSGTTTFDVNVDNASLQIAADILSVKALGITNAMLAGSIDLTTKVTGLLPIANGGTAGASAAAARTNLVVPTRVTQNSPALTAGVWTDITHNLGIMPYSIEAKIASSGELVDLDFRDKVGSETTIAQMKTDIPGGRAANYYSVWFLG